MTHPHPNRKFVPQVVLTRSGKINTAGASVNTAGVSVNTAVRPVNTGNPQQQEYKEKGVIDSGCSRHMTGNKCYLTKYEDYDGGFVSVGDGKGRISGKGKIKTGTLDFENVYFCKEHKYNLFSVSQICDKKNNVLFTNTECLVLSSDFKLLDESQVLLRVPRKDTIYNVDLKSVVPTKGLTCLFANATIDESNLWHIRLGYINFKNINKLVKGNLVRGLPSKIFKNGHSCVACQKGKNTKPSRIKREFSVARTPQQNGVAERRNRTLIEAARTMLVDSKLPTTFWAEAVNTACYVLNRVLVIKPHNKTPYELIRGRTPLIDFMKPFGFLENTPNVTGNGPDWLYDVDSLTISLNYVPVIAGNQTNGIAGTTYNIVTDPKVSEEYAKEKLTKIDESGASDKNGEDDQAIRSEIERLLQQENADGPSFTNDDPSSPVNAVETSNALEEHLFERFSLFKNAFTVPPISNVTPMDDTRIFGNAYDDEDVGAEADLNNLETTINVSPIPTTRIDKDHPKDQIIRDFNSAIQTSRMTKISDEHAMQCYINKQRRTNHKDYHNYLFASFLSQIEPKKVIQALEDPSWIEAMQDELLQFQLQKVWTLVNLPNDKRAIGTKWVFRNKKDERGIVVRNKARLVAQGYTQEEGIYYDEVFAPVRSNQVYVDDIIFGSTKKSLCDEFEGLMNKRFQMSSIGELTFFLGLQVQQKKDGIFISQDKYVADILKKFDFATVKTARTPMKPNKALIKDEEADTSRLDIMFAVYACARFQVTPKMSHLHAVKRIFRYLKCQPKLGLWYPRDSLFDLEAFSDSDYAGASLDRKSTIGGCQFLSKRLISWQCKKQTIVSNSTTEAEYVVAANYCGQVLWIQNQMLDYGFNFMNIKVFIDNESTICIVKNLVFHSKTKHIEIRHHFIRDCYEKKLIQVIKIHTDHNVADILTKAFDVSRFNFLIASIGLLNL
ncbi:putative ribonuclease H-like domain-containing protein [Tanacetum coccineum]|uniref:Ribonuclease H-like domain-containing protein n=1 Tax=Tanacetum coccineum TaxID=301880 RepID=A0ABQ5I1G4_9ASTR